ncbi:hypothetical protein LEP1GSC103_1838 [Leptospira borgpetersenii serovar Javanica str. UI 09931]|uniref:Glyoxalase-like domain protein n=4 Tax=Leptospira borgpetersenii TaxID=174 RepID=M3HUH4_LEPBO|nr:hypothetical protein LEP1GSC128_2483 [Leptospira borgpetersenii str. 200801926]EMG01235.1 hypothetical protein LEP1GSC123_0701 [Leptospira borgpetersenii str. 200701203]EMN18283.1 hypothetical protein LEP1GSC056_4240 [Leptospira borgpetersenii str. Brem 328]EMN57065.1 hypothetical protein LEP1GSC090_0888 [Leptospira borgpetersenii serovar Javanica str. MK146]ENO65666.1 hypothetical protein LEP1GSC191_2280 [Leptospira borgpetersenii serovar Mini str. 201000851]EPG56822.1 hypothetical protein
MPVYNLMEASLSENYENIHRLCYVRGPEGVIVALVEQSG